MNELMREHGGFEHNLQALRIVDRLEKRYPGFAGLNLTFEVREGIFKHSPRHRQEGPAEFLDRKEPVLEAQIVDLADEVAYNNHDLEDGLYSQILKLGGLGDVELWKEHYAAARQAAPGEEDVIHIRMTIRRIINLLATDLIRTTEENLEAARIGSLEDVRAAGRRLVGFSPEVAGKQLALKRYLFENLYRHYRVNRMAQKAKRTVTELFRAYLETPQQLPPHFQQRIPEEGVHRVTCDYIAGMTDRFALDEYRKLFDPLERV
jgi:dGTPase